ncbi:hypothetical protein RUND412_004531 [Rhizina undulata]
MAPKPHLNVLIIGAGLGGLAAAIAITKAGHTVTILEQAPQLGEVGAGIQVPPNSSRILLKWGLGPEMSKVSVLPQAFRLRRYQDGKLLSEQSLIPLTDEVYGAPYWHVHRADFHQAMVNKARDLGVKILLDSCVSKVDFETPAVHLTNSTVMTADLIIGADGLKSKCREELLGRADPPHLTGDLAYRILIKAEEMAKHPELSELAEKPAINFWMGPDAHAVCYLLKGGGLYNIVLLCPDNLPATVNVAAADPQEVKDFFKTWDPKLQKMLSMVHQTTKWRLQNSREMAAWSHPSGKFTLMGDACHATLPYLAQGAAMAVEDGAVLGGLLSKIERKEQVADVLKIFEDMRKSRTTKLVLAGTHQRNVFHLHDGKEQEERDRVLLADQVFDGFPNKWRDANFRDFMFTYDAFEEVEKAWEKYSGGKQNEAERSSRL